MQFGDVVFETKFDGLHELPCALQREEQVGDADSVPEDQELDLGNGTSSLSSKS